MRKVNGSKPAVVVWRKVAELEMRNLDCQGWTSEGRRLSRGLSNVEGASRAIYFAAACA
jgi:hypothetical protein